MYIAHVVDETKNETIRLEDYPVLQEFRDFFPDEIIGIPPKRDIDFTIELVLREAPVSKTPYRMSTPEMLQAEDATARVVGKKSISDQVCPLGEHQFYL